MAAQIGQNGSNYGADASRPPEGALTRPAERDSPMKPSTNSFVPGFVGEPAALPAELGGPPPIPPPVSY